MRFIADNPVEDASGSAHTGLLSYEDLAEWQRRWQLANSPAAMRRAWKQQLRETLPRRVRGRLWLDMWIDDVATWLCDHGHERLCVALWRATGLWSG